MTWQMTPYTAPLCLAMLISLGAAYYIWRRGGWEAVVSIIILLSGAEWTATYILEISLISLPQKVFWNEMQYIGGSIMISGLYILALQSAGRDDWLTRRNVVLVNIVPAVSLAFIFTNKYHRLIWPYHVLVARKGILWLEHPHGLLYWVYVGYLQLLILFILIFLIWSLTHSPPRYRRQIWMIFGSLSVPFVVSLLGPFGFNFLYPLNLNQLIFVLLIIPLAWGLLRLQVGDVVPVARTAVFDGMADSVIVLDGKDKIIDINPAAQTLFNCSAKKVIGQPITTIWQDGRFSDAVGQPVPQFWLKPSGRIYQSDQNPELNQEVVFGHGAEKRTFGARISPLVDWRNYIVSQVIVLREITERVYAQQTLQKAKEDLEAKVAERTTELSEANARLQNELTIRRMAEVSLQVAHDELETRVRERTAELSIMLEAAKTVSSTLELDETLLIIAQKMVEAIGVSGCAISRYDQAADALMTWIEWRTDGYGEERGTIYALADFPASRAVLDERRPMTILVSDPEADPAETAHMRRVELASLLMLPLIAGQETIGMVELDENERERVFTEAEIQLCQALADQAGIAIKNARLYTQAQAEIGERKLAEEQIQASLAEKEVLLKEIHHRVKNNLQVISSLFNLQSGYVEDEQTLTAFWESQNRVRSMALIHEKLYQSTNLARIEFGDYVENLAADLFRSYSRQARGVRLQVEAEPVYLDIDTAVPCGLILNELISNALKYAFPDGRSGEIAIALDLAGPDRVRLRVADNGVGLPPGLDSANTASLGFQLVHALVSQLQGDIQIEPTNGAQFIITFPLNEKQGAPS